MTPVFISGFKYEKGTKPKCQILNFLSGEAKMVIYLTRRDRLTQLVSWLLFGGRSSELDSESIPSPPARGFFLLKESFFSPRLWVSASVTRLGDHF